MTRFDAERYVSDLERAWNDKDTSGFVSKYYDNNVEFTDPNGKPQRGATALRGIMDSWVGAFGEMKIKITRTIQNGNDVAILQSFTGRHTGEFEIAPGERVPATNKTATVDVAEFVKVNDQGKIVHDVTILDNARLLMQLGLLPGPGQPQQSRTAVKR
jgi:hypothetical protein